MSRRTRAPPEPIWNNSERRHDHLPIKLHQAGGLQADVTASQRNSEIVHAGGNHMIPQKSRKLVAEVMP